MSSFQREVLRAHGYRPGKRCGQTRNPPELCPALSLPDLFATAGGGRRDVRRLLDSVPAYFSQGVVTADRRTANLAFGIRLMPLDRQKEVVDDMKRRLDPPPGVEAAVVGLPVLAAEANGALSSPWRRALTLLVALGGVFLVLLIVRRSAREAAVPLIPIALATGWSGLVVFLLGLLPGSLAVDLNPMSVTLGALVIAISTEFSVLLSARYAEERRAGAGPARAIELTYASTGAAVLASGVTAIAGFAALIASDIRMLRDFGIITVVDLSVSLLGVMIVLPAALMWAEQHGPFRVRELISSAPPSRPGGFVVKDDRFGDLGAGRNGDDVALRRRPPRRPRPHAPRAGSAPRGPRSTNRYAWAVGIVFVMVLSVLLFVETLPNSGEALFGPEPDSAQGLRRPGGAEHARGRCERLPEGALPRAGRGRAGLLARLGLGGQRLSPAPPPARADLRVRPRGRLLSPGGSHGEGQGAGGRRSVRDRLLHAQGARRGAQPGPGAGLDSAGGYRRGWCGGQPLRSGRLPDHDLRPRRRAGSPT